MPNRWYKDSERKAILGRIDALEDAVRDYVWDMVTAKADELLIDVEQCESPIEKMFCVALNAELAHLEDMYGFLNLVTVLNPQYELTLGNRAVRVDFRLAVLRNPATEEEREFNIVIECDGHDFHERTKQQAARDKSRDRQLITLGYHVLRFTGSEIWADPRRCAKEVSRLVEYLAGL
jgi:hypothetical protein